MTAQPYFTTRSINAADGKKPQQKDQVSRVHACGCGGSIFLFDVPSLVELQRLAQAVQGAAIGVFRTLQAATSSSHEQQTPNTGCLL